MIKGDKNFLSGISSYSAKGYKIYKTCKMISKSLLSKKPFHKYRYYVAAENITVMKVSGSSEKKIQTLMIGSFVKIHSVCDTNLVDVKIIDYDGRYNISEDDVFRCPVTCLIPVDKTLWNLLLPIPSPIEKVELLKSPDLCNELCSIDVGSRVYVLPQNIGNKNALTFSPAAVVRYKGPINKFGSGIYFGLELSECFRECDTDGVVSGQRYFTCQPGRGLFVTVNRLRLRPQYTTRSSKKMSSVLQMANDFEKLAHSKRDYQNEEHSIGSKLKKYIAEQRLNPGDRVVWLSESGPSSGTICYLSHIDINAHVHLDTSRNQCKTVSCDRSQSFALNTCDLILEDEFKRLGLECDSEIRCPSPEMKKQRSIPSDTDIEVCDLLGINEDSGIVCNGSTNSSWDRRDFVTSEAERYNTSPASEIDGGNKFKEVTHEKDELCNGGVTCRDNIYYNNSNSDMLYESDDNQDELVVGSLVEVFINEEPHYGVIRWIGQLMYGDEPTKPIAGIELEEEIPSGCDGTLNGYKYFDCHPKRGCFRLLSQCQKDSRFQDQSHSLSTDMKSQKDFGCPVIAGIVQPINADKWGHSLFGKYRGIQGHNNSCYLDATLFSMFAFTSVLDSLLLRPADKNDNKKYEEVQRVLREEIVNPLRQNMFVRADNVMKLRLLLENLTSVTGLTCEEKDPEEFLTCLVTQILKAKPFLKLSSGQDAYHYQLFVEKDEQLVLPTVQQLFLQSFISSDLKLKEVPSCLIIQMPRFGKSYKLYPRILPSQLLDVTDVIENSPRQCSLCGKLAFFECKECFISSYDGMKCISFCSPCVRSVHNHADKCKHDIKKLSVPMEFSSMYDSNNNSVPKLCMELFAVVCIETSHYVTFAKCGPDTDSPWCFFDSMADRTGGQNGYNIPEVVLCPDLPKWLSENGAQSLCDIKDERYLPEYAKRLLCDAYMCMYQSTDVMMYH